MDASMQRISVTGDSSSILFPDDHSLRETLQKRCMLNVITFMKALGRTQEAFSCVMYATLIYAEA